MNDHVKLCREKTIIKGPATLGIHSSVAGDDYEYTSGHAWISVATNKKVYFLGLWPDGHPHMVEKSPFCTDVRLGMEAGVRPMVSRYYVLNQFQLNRLNSFVNRSDVWTYSNNCTNWAVRLLKDVVGVRIDPAEYKLFSTPRELGASLLELEKEHRTSAKNPIRGPAPEVQKSLFGSL